jgi:hypothetical protein
MQKSELLLKIKEYLIDTSNYDGDCKNIDEIYLKQIFEFLNTFDKKNVEPKHKEQLIEIKSICGVRNTGPWCFTCDHTNECELYWNDVKLKNI